GHDGHRLAEAELRVLVRAELAQGNERVDMARLPREQIAGAPELRRALVCQRAAHALTTRAEFAIVPPENVHRTHQPVLVGRIQLHARSVREKVWSANQRHVVEMDDVESARKNLA